MLTRCCLLGKSRTGLPSDASHAINTLIIEWDPLDSEDPHVDVLLGFPEACQKNQWPMGQIDHEECKTLRYKVSGRLGGIARIQSSTCEQLVWLFVDCKHRWRHCVASGNALQRFGQTLHLGDRLCVPSSMYTMHQEVAARIAHRCSFIGCSFTRPKLSPHKRNHPGLWRCFCIDCCAEQAGLRHRVMKTIVTETGQELQVYLG